MPAASGESSHSVTITLNMGRTSLRVGTYAVDGPDAVAKASVVDALVRHVLSEWPNVIYRDQLAKLVRQECSSKPTE